MGGERGGEREHELAHGTQPHHHSEAFGDLSRSASFTAVPHSSNDARGVVCLRTELAHQV